MNQMVIVFLKEILGGTDKGSSQTVTTAGSGTDPSFVTSSASTEILGGSVTMTLMKVRGELILGLDFFFFFFFNSDTLEVLGGSLRFILTK